MSDAFLILSPPYFLTHGLSLNVEVTDSNQHRKPQGFSVSTHSTVVIYAIATRFWRGFWVQTQILVSMWQALYYLCRVPASTFITSKLCFLVHHRKAEQR